MAKHHLEAGAPLPEILKSESSPESVETQDNNAIHTTVSFEYRTDVSETEIKACQAWLKNLYDATDVPYIENDDIGTTFESCGSVLLAMCYMQCVSAQQISEATGLPGGFVATVIFTSDLGSKGFLLLYESVKASYPQREFHIIEALHAVLEEYDCHLPLFDTNSLLNILRDDYLFEGKKQHWCDPESDHMRPIF